MLSQFSERTEEPNFSRERPRKYARVPAGAFTVALAISSFVVTLFASDDFWFAGGCCFVTSFQALFFFFL